MSWRVRDEELVDEVLVLDGRRHLALAAAPLGLVVGDRLRLRVARMRQRDDEVLALDQVLDRDVGLVGDDLRAPRVAVGFLHRRELAADHREQPVRAREDFAEVADQLEELL